MARSSMMVALAVAILSPALPAIAAPAGQYPPGDECAAIRDFAPVRAALKKAVATRNAVALLNITSPTIVWGFGDVNGTRSTFASHWGLNDPKKAKTSAIWAEMDAVMKLGCAVDDGMIAMPHMFWRLPANDIGPATFLVTGTRVNLRAAPDLKARVLGALSWEVVEDMGGDEKGAAGWRKVRTKDGRQGYIRQDFLRDGYDYRIIFAREKGRWRITAFVAGD